MTFREITEPIWDGILNWESGASYLNIMPAHELRRLPSPKLASGVNGVYFLFSGEEIVYVGQSRDCYNRLRQHQEKDYDSFVIHEADPGEGLNNCEAMNILYFMPRLNRSVPPNGVFMTTSELARQGITREWLREQVRARHLACFQFLSSRYFLRRQVLELLEWEAL